MDDQVKTLDEFKLKKAKLTQQNYVLKKLNFISHNSDNIDKNVLEVPLQKENISYIAGILAKDEMMRFIRTIFRAARGNAYTTSEDCVNENIEFGKQKAQAFFTITFKNGDEIKKRLLRICDTFGANYFEVDKNYEKTIKDNEAKIADADGMIQLTRDSIL